MPEPDFKSMAASTYEKLKKNITGGVMDDDDSMMAPEVVDIYNTAMLAGLMARAYDMGKKGE